MKVIRYLIATIFAVPAILLALQIPITIWGKPTIVNAEITTLAIVVLHQIAFSIAFAFLAYGLFLNRKWITSAFAALVVAWIVIVSTLYIVSLFISNFEINSLIGYVLIVGVPIALMIFVRKYRERLFA